MLRVADYAQLSDTGRQRRANEDSYYARSPLFAVADGMGGAQAGEVASRTAIEVVGDGLADGAGSPEERLAARVAEANARIHELSVTDRDRAGMGTTMTAAYVAETEVALAHVGDSRAYLLRDGALERLTRDHSLVEEFVREGRLTQEEADEHPQRSIITRALGPEADVDVDRLSVRGRDGDVFLLCSDGLTSMVPDARVAEIVAAAPSLAQAARTLVAAANDAGGRDNITVVLFRLEEVGARQAADTEQHTAAGVAAPSTAEVRAAVATAPPAPPRERAERRLPRQPSPGGAVRRRIGPSRQARSERTDGDRTRGRASRMRRWGLPALVALLVGGPIVGGAILALQAVYFIGVTRQGDIAVFQGLPYDLPFGVHLYSADYVTGLTPQQLPPARRRKLLDHKLRSHDDAHDLARQLELGRLAVR